MLYSRRTFMALLSTAAVAPLAGQISQALASTTSAASASSTSSTSSASSASSANSGTCDVSLDGSKWCYDADNDLYYQIGVVYCATPQATDYESCAIYVPGAFMDATANADGTTYTCTPSATGTVAGFTAATAPIVMPINTGGYAAQAAATTYDGTGLSTYMEAGFVYVYSGCRGKTNGTDTSGNVTFPGGAPWGVTDLKACVRFLRGNASLVPGDKDRIFTFGHSGGGAQSSLMGATGNSELFTPYLEQIGAVMTDSEGNTISDAVCGSMCWCPVTSLDYADEAYEWNMGQFATTDTRAEGTFTQALSQDLAKSYADYLNQLGLEDGDGNVLTLSESDDGIYTSGTYYDYLMGVIEGSLNDFLSDTTFPYTPTSSFMADGGFPGSGSTGMGMGMGGRMSSGSAAVSGSAVASTSTVASASATASGSTAASDSAAISGSAAALGSLQASGSATASGSTTVSGSFSGSLASGSMPSGMPSGGMMGMMGMESTAVGTDSSTTYETVDDYIAALNVSTPWVTYDANTNTATITGMSDFVLQCKNPTKSVCAFDSLDRSAAENSLFCTPDQASSHFDPTLAQLLSDNESTYSAFSDWSETYPSDYEADLKLTDCADNSIEYRLNAYNPMYYLNSFYEGCGTTDIAPHWRINTGIDQGDTALTVETNLALALKSCKSVSDVSFTTVWGKAHTPAERTGDAATNLIAWVTSCCA